MFMRYLWLTLKIWACLLGVVQSCTFPLPWQRWGWAETIISSTNMITWVFTSDQHIMQQKSDVSPSTERGWRCKDLEMVSTGYYIQTDLEKLGVKNELNPYCLRIVSAADYMLVRKSPFTDGDGSCRQQDNSSLPLRILYRRPLIKCSAAPTSRLNWAFKYENYDRRNITSAESACSGWAGSHLAWFSSRNEWLTVYRKLKTYRKVEWLLGYKKVSGKYVTIDGDTTPGHFNWATGFPGIYGCVVTNGNNGYRWEDRKCNVMRNYICKTRCYTLVPFTMPERRSPFTELIGKVLPLSYSMDDDNIDVCKDNTTSVATFTEDQIVISSCTDINTYTQPLQTTLFTVGSVKVDEGDSISTYIILARQYGALHRFYCARYSVSDNLYLSLDISTFSQPSCQPGFTSKTYLSKQFLHFTIDLLNPTETPKVPINSGTNFRSALNIFTRSDGSLSSVTYGIIGGGAALILTIIIIITVCVKVSSNRPNNTRNTKNKEGEEGVVIPNYFGLGSRTQSAYDPYNPKKG